MSPLSVGTVKISPEFVHFFSRLAALSDALYPGGSPWPRFSYGLRQLPSNVDGLSLEISGQTLAGAGQQRNFTWSGSSEEVRAVAKGTLLGSYSGPWAIFHFVSGARWKPAGAGIHDLEVSVEVGPAGKGRSHELYLFAKKGLEPLQVITVRREPVHARFDRLEARVNARRVLVV